MVFLIPNYQLPIPNYQLPLQQEMATQCAAISCCGFKITVDFIKKSQNEVKILISLTTK
jgi:hypothetical protein